MDAGLQLGGQVGLVDERVVVVVACATAFALSRDDEQSKRRVAVHRGAVRVRTRSVAIVASIWRLYLATAQACCER